MYKKSIVATNKCGGKVMFLSKFNTYEIISKTK